MQRAPEQVAFPVVGDTVFNSRGSSVHVTRVTPVSGYGLYIEGTFSSSSLYGLYGSMMVEAEAPPDKLNDWMGVPGLWLSHLTYQGCRYAAVEVSRKAWTHDGLKAFTTRLDLAREHARHLEQGGSEAP